MSSHVFVYVFSQVGTVSETLGGCPASQIDIESHRPPDDVGTGTPIFTSRHAEFEFDPRWMPSFTNRQRPPDDNGTGTPIFTSRHVEFEFDP